MSDRKGETADAIRLEGLWSGSFGDEYLARNANAGEGRGPFWTELMARVAVRTVLEVGCNVGGNLRWLAPVLGSEHVYGVDVHAGALEEVRRRLPGINAIASPARELPFRDRWFDLVFTAGVLIHQPAATLPRVMGEVVRTARRYVLAIEYFAAETEEGGFTWKPSRSCSSWTRAGWAVRPVGMTLPGGCSSARADPDRAGHGDRMLDSGPFETDPARRPGRAGRESWEGSNGGPADPGARWRRLPRLAHGDGLLPGRQPGRGRR